MNLYLKPGQVWSYEEGDYIRTFIVDAEGKHDDWWVTVSHNGHIHKFHQGSSVLKILSHKSLVDFFEKEGFVLFKEDITDPDEQKKYHSYDWYLPPDDWWDLSPETIKKVLKLGHRVFWKNKNYEVIKDTKGQYLLHCHLNGTYVGVFKTDGTLVEDQKEFFHVKEVKK